MAWGKQALSILTALKEERVLLLSHLPLPKTPAGVPYHKPGFLHNKLTNAKIPDISFMEQS